MATDTRLPLSRERILQTALELADESGIESVTMRKLGQVLGFEAMSLYNHVANKDDLLDGILDLVLAESEPPAPEGDWDEAVRASAISIHAALRRHGWSSALLMTGRIRPARLRYMDSLLGRLREAGLLGRHDLHHLPPARRAHLRLRAVGSRATTSRRRTRKSSLRRSCRCSADYPYLREHGEQHMSEGPHHEVSAFELGLDLIIDGLREMRAG